MHFVRVPGLSLQELRRQEPFALAATETHIIFGSIALQLGEGAESTRVSHPVSAARVLGPTSDTRQLSGLPSRPTTDAVHKPDPPASSSRTGLTGTASQAYLSGRRRHGPHLAPRSGDEDVYAEGSDTTGTPATMAQPMIFQAPLTSTGATHILDTDSAPQGLPPIPVDDDDAETLRPAPAPATPTGGGQVSHQGRPPPFEVDLAAGDDHMPVEDAPKTPGRLSAPYGRESPEKQARPAPVDLPLSSGVVAPQPPRPYPIGMPPASLPHPLGAPPAALAAPTAPAPTPPGCGQPTTTVAQPHPPAHITTSEPSNHEIMTLLQQILHNQEQDRDAIAERCTYAQHGLDTIKRRLDGHEGHVTALEQRVNKQASAALERATAAEARSIAAASAQFNQLQTKIAVLEEQHQRLAGQRPNLTPPVTTIDERDPEGDHREDHTNLAYNNAGRHKIATRRRRWFSLLVYIITAGRDIYAPYILGSICLIKCPTESQGRQLLAQARGAFGRKVVAAGHTLRLYISVQKTKPERDRNKRLTTIAATRQQAVTSTHKAAKEQKWNAGDRHASSSGISG